MTGSPFDLGRTDSDRGAGSPALTALFWPLALLAGYFAVVQAAHAIYGSIAYLTPMVGEVDPVRSLSRAVYFLAVFALTFPLCALMARRGSSLAGIAEIARAWLVRPGWRNWQIGVSLVLVLTAVWLLRAFPNSGDEYNYIFQAETFRHGHLWVPVPEHQDLFAFSHIFMKDGKWVSQYAPGWGAILALGGTIGLPYWIINPLLAVGCLWAAWAVAKQRAGQAAGTAAVVLLGLSAFFIFTSASYFPHLACATFGMIFCWQAERYRQAPAVRPALVMGLALGVVGLIRPYDAVLFALPLAIATLLQLKVAHLKYVLFVAAAGAPFLVATFFYNWSITGDPLFPVTNWGYPSYRLGFNPTDEAGRDFTWIETAHHAVSRVVLLGEWTSLPFLVLFVSSWAHLWRRGKLQPSDWVFPVFVAGYLLAPGFGGNQYGPRYYFAAFPMMVLTCSTAIADWLGERWSERESRFGVALFVAHVLVALSAFAPIGYGVSRIVAERMHVYDLVDSAKLDQAVVVLSAPVGVLHPMGPKDLTRNGIDLQGPVVYALARPGWEEALREMFPDRRMYLYTREITSAWGRLTPLPPG
ncbi:hypothetical protein [Desertibaculum subflavum]|uniref:hypothetical protein n=1 Tax=Desertibaculum subflavum TaxID=2268458 RepID=UPI000E660B8F